MKASNTLQRRYGERLFLTARRRCGVVCDSSRGEKRSQRRCEIREPNPNPLMRKAHDQVKQEVEEDEEKKNKIETLKLSLALPDVSLSLMASNTNPISTNPSSSSDYSSFPSDLPACPGMEVSLSGDSRKK
ncbi:hypothetical protein HID58_090823 [Brassica napus]|uniref:Uncharacterized protein n=1 Tax=Brassica napus TaxID=3708 RepID=A0ABQ7X8Y1_BRANA|nr:hypothetical protein HID58_090823 [Brassica napus]